VVCSGGGNATVVYSYGDSVCGGRGSASSVCCGRGNMRGGGTAQTAKVKYTTCDGDT